MTNTVVGIDWGTSNRRAYVLEDGRLVRRHADHCGILAVKGGFEVSLTDLLATLGVTKADVLMSGMVGSRNGWREVSYIGSDMELERLGDFLADMPSVGDSIRCRCVPGIRYIDEHGTPDVMRGEETQILGAMALGAGDGWYVLPGTHCKWVKVEDGRIARIATFMTGEFFSLLTQHGTLAALMQDEQPEPEAFEAGLRAAQRSGVTHAAFGCRALVVTDAMPASHAAAYLSGLLIGAELAETRKQAVDGAVQIIGSPHLAERYVAALEYFDIRSRAWQPDEVYIAALAHLSNKGKIHA